MFKENLKYLRKSKDLTQKEIAEDLGITQPTYQQWESGKRSPTAETLEKLADYFDVTTDYLLGREDKEDEVSPWTATVARATVKLIKPGLPKEETRKLLSQIFGKKAPEIIAAIEQEYYNKPENIERIKSNDDLYQQKEIERDIEKNIDNKN